MNVLHVAAMPFPSVQGTQAAVRAMIDAEHDAGRAPELLTYSHGSDAPSVPWTIHRVRDVGDRSLRSGPSWRKLVSDAQLVLALRRHAHGGPIVAHHVEAAAAALAARVRPLVFFAHTALGPELPTYVPARMRALASRAGAALDIGLVRRADAVVAVSPRLASLLGAAAEREVVYVPVPWALPRPIDPAERRAARVRLGISPVAPVLLYSGNLDAYQGLDVLARAFALLLQKSSGARLLVATASARKDLESTFARLGCAERVAFASLAGEDDRRLAHAAADVACVPRAAEGGLPIKLLDALARGVPTVATRRATSGLELGGAALVAADDDPEALAAAALIVVEAREASAELARRGVEYVRAAHAPARYLDAMDAALGKITRRRERRRA